MMRHKYGYNCQVVNWGGMNEFNPLGYIEVVPGETLTGTVSAAFRSQPMKLAVDTRAYVDVFAFYVPFRLVWDSFPQWIASAGAVGGPPPLVTDLFNGNFEQRFSLTSDNTTYTSNVAFQRRAYNLIWNKFFRRQDQAERNIDQAGIAFASQRPSTLETQPLLGSQYNIDTQVPLSGTSPNQTLSLNQFRATLARDNFAKLRAWYGSKYIDYLAAIGVQTQWSILDEPELLGQKHMDWRFQRTTQTGPSTTPTAPDQVSVGQTAGHFFTGVKLGLKRCFAPEHGLVCFYGVTRADAIFGVSPMPPHLCKVNAEQYWSPERDVLAQDQVPLTTGQAPGPYGLSPQIFASYATVAAGQPFTFPNYQEYRIGMNMNAQGGVVTGPVYGLIAGKSSMTNDRYVSLINADYNANMVLTSSQMYQVTNQMRLVRHSPVRRVDQRIKLS